MVSYIREMAVIRNRWLDEERFKEGVALCQSIPGATAMQTAAYVGLRARDIKGALASFAGFGLPAFILMVVLSSLYARYHAVPGIVSLFNGLQIIVVAIVANATYSFGRSTFRNYRDVFIATASGFLFWIGISPFVVIIGAASAGALFFRNGNTGPPTEKAEGADHIVSKKLLPVILIVLSVLLALYLADSRLLRLALLMMRIDLFAFGGAFASIPLMLHEIVDVRRWMDSKTFMDGIALGQVTPGPIVITSAFVGYMLYGIGGAIVASAAILTPSFLMVVFVTPVFDRLKSSAFFTGATKGILASFVGLLFYVMVKFGLAVPWDLARLVFVAAAFFALVRKVDMLYVIPIGAVVSIIIF